MLGTENTAGNQSAESLPVTFYSTGTVSAGISVPYDPECLQVKYQEDIDELECPGEKSDHKEI